MLPNHPLHVTPKISRRFKFLSARWFFLFLLCSPLLVHARKGTIGPPTQRDEGPWFTGPLLTGSAHVIPPGHANIEPYIYWTHIPGRYNKHWHFEKTPPTFRVLLFQTSLQIGILPATELDLIPQFAYNSHGGQHLWRIADMPVALAFRLLQDDPETWRPALKLRIGTVLPLGKHDHFKAHKRFTDEGGLGDWAPNVVLLMGKSFHLGGIHDLHWRMSIGYAMTAPVSVHGLSAWGGVPSNHGTKGTHGTVYPGCLLTFLQGFEYSLTRNWVLALDIEYLHINRTRFSGHSPKIPGIQTKPIAPSADQFSLAPAIEYNFNAHVGIITGPWFSIAGRNDNQTGSFFSWVFAINIYH